MTEQAETTDQQLGGLLTKMEQALGQQGEGEQEQETFADESYPSEAHPEDRLSREEERRIEALFEVAREDRSRAYELKQELDRLNVFADYEDRFLDLFKKED